MPLLRLTLLVLAVFFCFFLGRNGARLHRSKQPYTRALTWTLRAVVALGGILWIGGFDAIGIAAVLLSAAAFFAGIYVETHPPKAEEIHLFGDEPPRE